MTDLLKCPFCGSDPKITKDLHISRDCIHINWLIRCENCGRARTSAYPTEYEVTTEETLEKIPFGAPYKLRDGRQTAIDEWNTRASEKEPVNPNPVPTTGSQVDIPSMPTTGAVTEAGNETGT